MAQRTSSRPVPARGARSPVVPTAPAQVLRPRPSTHLRDGAALAGLGMLGYGAASLAGHPELDWVALTVGVGAGTGVSVRGERDRRRAELSDRLVEALSPLLGVRQLDRRIVRLSRWTAGWPGTPRRIVVRYASGAPDSDPQWKPTILSTVGSRLLSAYEVVDHDPRKCRLTLRLVSGEEKAPPPRALVRAERAVTELIGATAKVTASTYDGEELTSITVSHQAGAKLAASGYRNRIERVISTMMPGRWRAVWDLEGDTVRFEVRPTLPESVWLPPDVPDTSVDLLRNYREVRIAYAVDEDGREHQWYPARVPQVMLTGGTGTGKTSTAHAVLGKITQHEWPVWVLDAKRVEFLAFRDWPNVQIVAGSIPDQVALVRRAWELMEYRYELIEAGRASINDFEPLVVFLDEFAEFRQNLLEWYAQVKVKGDPTKPPTLSEVASLARKARTARIHMVLSTQRPDAEFLGGEMRDNFGQRISMGRLSPQGAMMMWENPSVGVSLPRARTGRATSTYEDGRPVEVQCYRFPDLDAPEGSEERQRLQALRPARARHPRLVIIPPEQDPEVAAREDDTPRFRDYARAQWALATDRPDLDPMTSARQSQVDGRVLSSTLASLGLAGHVERPRLRSSDTVDVSVAQAAQNEATGPWDDYEEYAGYAAPTTCSPHSVMVGDLIEVDPGVWVVVDEQPEDDLAAPGMVAISWRGDGDESGSLSLPDDTDVAVRRPEEEDT